MFLLVFKILLRIFLWGLDVSRKFLRTCEFFYQPSQYRLEEERRRKETLHDEKKENEAHNDERIDTNLSSRKTKFLLLSILQSEEEMDNWWIFCSSQEANFFDSLSFIK